MTKTCALLFVAFAAAAICQTPKPAANNDLGYTTTPMLPGLPYHVHDPARPHPKVVTPASQAGGGFGPSQEERPDGSAPLTGSFSAYA